MRKFFKIITFSFAFLSAAIFPPVLFAATISFNPDSGTFGAGKTFNVSLSVDGGGQAVNAAEANITFDKSILSVQSVSKDGSAFGMWPVEPVFDNAKGTISLGGGTATAFSGKKNILTIVFKGSKEGDAQIAVASGNITAADGKGTDILAPDGKKTATFTIGKAETTTTAPPPPPSGTTPSSGNISLPAIPIIASATHPDPEKWYKENTAVFKWTVPRDVDNVRITLDDSPRSVPSLSNTPPIFEKEFKDIADGTKYFHVMFHNKSGWGTPAHRQVLIDKTPPEKFTIESRSDSPSPGDTSLVFLVTDKSSGIDYYEMSIAGASSTRILADEVSSKGEYKLDKLPEGDHKVKIRAFDKVGNMTEAETTFTVAKPVAVVAPAGEVVVAPPASTLPYWVSLVFVALCVFLSGILFSERRKFAREKEQIKSEADEAGDKTGKVFSALRDEVEEQIRALSAKPNLSDFEREILERIKEALDMSEEIIDKEIEDVRKLLR
jgi:hypothetical protein